MGIFRKNHIKYHGGSGNFSMGMGNMPDGGKQAEKEKDSRSGGVANKNNNIYGTGFKWKRRVPGHLLYCLVICLW